MIIYIILFLLLVLILCKKKKKVYQKELYINDEDLNSYVICVNDKTFNVARKNLSKYFPNLKKYDAVVIKNIDNYDPKLLSISALRSIFYDKQRKTHADLGSLGAVGCALSHYNIWSKIEKDSGMYIFESDAVCIENPIKYVNNFKKDFHILLFGGFDHVKSNSKRNIIKVNDRFYGLHGYYITYEGAQILSKYMFPIEQQVDSYISDILLLQKKLNIELNIYIINPGICFQKNNFGTLIQTKSVYNLI
jgi:GR25 family glycosyltransferase involved in LPS biosynthesis